MTNPIIEKVAQALAHLCSSTVTCPFDKGRDCPVETYLSQHHPELCPNRYPLHCGFANSKVWYSLIMSSIQLNPPQVGPKD